MEQNSRSKATDAGMVGGDSKVEGGKRPEAVQGSRVLGNRSVPLPAYRGGYVCIDLKSSDKM